MGKSGGLSGGCGLSPQHWGGGEHQRPGQTEKVTVRSLHFISLVVILVPDPTHEEGSGDIQLTLGTTKNSYFTVCIHVHVGCCLATKSLNLYNMM